MKVSIEHDPISLFLTVANMPTYQLARIAKISPYDSAILGSVCMKLSEGSLLVFGEKTIHYASSHLSLGIIQVRMLNPGTVIKIEVTSQ